MSGKLFRHPIKLKIFDDRCILLSKIVETAQTSNPAVRERRGETWLLSITSNSTWTWLAISEVEVFNSDSTSEACYLYLFFNRWQPSLSLPPLCFVDWHWNQRWAKAACCQDTPEANGANIVPPRSAGNQRGQRMATQLLLHYTLSVPAKRHVPYAYSCNATGQCGAALCRR